LASQRGTLSRKKIAPELSLAINQAVALMQRKKQRILTAEMILLAFALTPDTDAYRVLQQFSQTQGFNWDAFVQDVDRAAADRRPPRDEQFDFVTDTNARVALGGEVLVVLDDGLTLADTYADGRCSSAHALAVMANIQIGTHWLLNRRGISAQAVLSAIGAVAATGDSALPPAKTLPFNPVYHRSNLEAKLVNLLSMKSARNVILVGPTGVGKRSLVLGVGQLIIKGQGPLGVQSVVELDETRLLDNAVAAVEDGIRRAKGGLLFVPDVARFFGGIRADFREDAGNALQKAFLSNEVVVIGTATEEAYTKTLQTARVVAERSQILRVPPATVDETTEILGTLKPKFEADYDLTIAAPSLAEAARLAGRYYTVKPLPGAAVELLHRACANVKTSRRGSTDAPPGDNQLDPDDVMITASLLTGIPVNTMGADERNRYINMVTHLQQRIIGQETAVLALSRAVKMARVGLKDPKRPIGSFLFLGPTGVGKSELAKALAEFMFGTERALITLDMSEYMDASSVNRLIGSPPGYVGHEQGGQLTDAVKKQPYSVVLFDEVEKANPKVFDSLLQVMDEGRLTSGQGETVSFSECVILMTSNIGGHHLADVRLSHDIPANPEGDGEAGNPAYNTPNIRKMLAAGFSADELLTLFGADPTFALNPADFAGDASQAAIVDKLLELAGQKSQFDLLLELAEKYNAAKYQEFEPYFNWAVACRRAETELKAHFRPEFLNRLDDIIYFHPLNAEHLGQILDLLLKNEQKLLAGQNLELKITAEAKSWLLAQNDHPEWGARPLRRLIQRHIREGLAEYLLRESPPPGTVMNVQVGNDKLQIEQEPREQKS